MIIAKLPFEKFLKLLRISGREQGFIFLIIFIAREADCPQVFKQLERTWSSLHDLTGSEILFLTIDGTNSYPSPIEEDKQHRFRDDVGFIDNSRGSIIYSPECKLLQRIEDASVQDNYNRNCIDSNIRPTRRNSTWRDEQTLGISSLLKSLKEVQEEDTPCLYFESLLSNHRFNVPIWINDKQLSIYDLLKLTFNKTRGCMLEMRKTSLSRKELLKSVRNLEASIKFLKAEPSSTIKKLMYSKSWLEEWYKSNELLKPEIHGVINSAIDGNLQITDVYSGISHLKGNLDPRLFSELRSHLNRMVDCRHLLNEVKDLEDTKYKNQALIGNKRAEIENLEDKINHLENVITKISHEVENTIKLIIQNKMPIIQQKDKHTTKGSKCIIYAEKYFEKIEYGYHDNQYNTENNTTLEIGVMSGDRHINTGGGNYIESNSGVYVQGNYLDMGQDLIQAATQIQDLVEQLQKRGMTVDVAQEKVAQDMATQAQNNLAVKNKLVKWGQSLGDAAAKATVSDVVKGVVKLALAASGLPVP